MMKLIFLLLTIIEVILVVDLGFPVSAEHTSSNIKNDIQDLPDITWHFDIEIGNPGNADEDNETTKLDCQNPVMYVTYYDQSKSPARNGVYLYYKSETGKYTMQNDIKVAVDVRGAITDRSGRHMYISDIEGNVTTYSRNTCTEEFKEYRTQKTVKYFAFEILLDPSEQYILEIDNNLALLTVWKIKNDGTLKLTYNNTLSSGPKTPVFHPTMPSLVAVPTFDKGLIQFFEFDDANGVMTPLKTENEVPRSFNLQQIVFSIDGKFMYAVGTNNVVCSFELKKAADSNEVKLIQLGNPLSTVEEGTQEFPSSNKIVINPKGDYLYVLNYVPPSIATFSVTNGQLNRTYVLHDFNLVYDFAITADGEHLVVVSLDDIFLIGIGINGSLKREDKIHSSGSQFIWMQQRFPGGTPLVIPDA